MPTVGSLFSGIGGLDLARFRDVRDCHGAGLYVSDTSGDGCRAWSSGNVEYDGLQPPQRRSQPGEVSKGLARSCYLEPVDLICGGYPCQPVSHAGRRMGESDSRWLWPEFYRIICEVRPRWVLAENVPGLLSIDDGRLFGGILRDLAEAGYDAVWFVLSAAAVGAPHLRERVFIVAHTNCCGNSQSGLQQPGLSSESSEVAHAAEPGLEGAEPTGRTRSQRLFAECSPLAHANGRRREQRDTGKRRFPEPNAGSGRAVEQRVRRVADELSEGMDRGWWDSEWEGVSRTIKGQKDRVNRLRGLGNAVVPAVAQQIGEWIMAFQ